MLGPTPFGNLGQTLALLVLAKNMFSLEVALTNGWVGEFYLTN
jgi:hypothetical protein